MQIPVSKLKSIDVFCIIITNPIRPIASRPGRGSGSRCSVLPARYGKGLGMDSASGYYRIDMITEKTTPQSIAQMQWEDKVEFERWLNVEQPSRNRATFEVSGNEWHYAGWNSDEVCN
jgi:hypothetical protein